MPDQWFYLRMYGMTRSREAATEASPHHSGSHQSQKQVLPRLQSSSKPQATSNCQLHFAVCIMGSSLICRQGRQVEYKPREGRALQPWPACLLCPWWESHALLCRRTEQQRHLRTLRKPEHNKSFQVAEILTTCQQAPLKMELERT